MKSIEGNFDNPKVNELYVLLQKINKISNLKEKNIELELFFNKNKDDKDLINASLMPTDGVYPNFENIFTVPVNSNIVTSGTTISHLNTLNGLLMLDDSDATEKLEPT